jgi:L-seryl-tRNA(Ser) seleniumtransferase
MTSSDKSPPIAFRKLPSIDRLLRLQEGLPQALCREAARQLVEELRHRMQEDWPPTEGEESLLSEAALNDRLAAIREGLVRPWHRRVLNATGILLHTGLGRSPLPAAACAALSEVGGAATVEVDPNTGKRNRREHAVAAHLMALTGAEAALVVNNNAAATLLALDALARGKKVPVSRGELVEIGGGFRMPDVMERAGCRLVEVGATNKTRLADFERVIDDETGCLLKVHPSNYRIEGFTAEVSLEDLVTLGREHGLPVYEDLGSGYLLEEPLPHDSRERSVIETLATGVDLVSISGDKLMGSCQAGILIGKKPFVDLCSQHPLYRALRLDKLALAVLEATLAIYRYGDPKQEIPVLRSIFTSTKDLQARGETLLKALEPICKAKGLEVDLGKGLSYVGSGATPARALSSRALAIRWSGGTGNIETLAALLREGRPSLWGRIENDEFLLDLRSLQPEEDAEIPALFEIL